MQLELFTWPTIMTDEELEQATRELPVDVVYFETDELDLVPKEPENAPRRIYSSR